MGDRTRNWRSLQVSWLRRQFGQGSGLPFSEVLSVEMVQEVPREDLHSLDDGVGIAFPSHQ